jgi:hypothetical protein
LVPLEFRKMQSQETGGSALGGGVRFRALSSICIAFTLKATETYKRMEEETYVLTVTLGTTCTAELYISTRWSHSTPKEVHCYSFLLQAEWTPEVLNADRMIRSLGTFSRALLGIEPGISDLVA